MTGSWRRRIPEPLIRRLADPNDPMTALIMDAMVGPALVIDPQGRIVAINAALSQIVASAPAVVVGDAFDAILHPTARAMAWDEIAPVLRGRANSKRFASSLLSGEASRDIEVAVLPVRAVGQPPSGAVLRLTDITTQRHLEAQLARGQTLQVIGQRASGIAHDFNNLLAAILGAADGIVQREAPGETVSDAAQIRSSAQRGAALVRQLLAFGRQQILQPRILAINAVIEDISGLLRHLLVGKMRLVVSLEQPGRLVRADPTQLDQVLVNLAVNARDAMSQGGELTLRTGHSIVDRPMIHGAEIIPPGRYVMIEVQDTGEGIPPQVLPRIFDPFFTTKRDRGGSGLGLSTVHGIVKQSDGFLVVESEIGVGTQVRIYLPCWDGADKGGIAHVSPIRSCAPLPTSDIPGSPLLVLLVDDNDTVRRLAEYALRRAGWEVLSADCGESALVLLESRGDEALELSALISDMVMPGMDGSAVAAAVRRRVGNPELPVILVSGYAQSQLAPGLAADNTGFLAKPYSLADLVAALRTACLQQA